MKKILVIEDERSIRKNLLALLTAEEFNVIGAENGSIGVQLARTEFPDLILCDIMMPELDGYGVLAALQQNPATAMIPVICLTARGDRAAQRQTMELGANDFLTKPFTRSELLGAIKTQLSKQEMLKQQQNTALQQAISQLNDLVYYDSLTNLPNRLLLRERFHQALSLQLFPNQIIPVAVLSLDQLDRFSHSLGTDYTDLLLQEISERVVPYVSEIGTVARLNSQQLALILPPVGEGQKATQMAQTIINELSQPFTLLGYKIFITSSIGIALYPNDGEDLDSLLKNAKAAMHEAQEQSGNCYQLYTAAMQEKSYERLMLELDLRHALERSEFQIHYQPQVDLQSGKIVAAEALIRWHHPKRGSVSPAEFIPLAEATGLIVPIDEWVLRTVCRQAKDWQETGFFLPVAVNLSAVQFNEPGLSDRVAQILEATGLEPRFLELELTESAVVQNPTRAIATLKELKALGIHLSLDDFGTGYSSLSYLQQFPFDTLKIDRFFVSELSHEDKNSAIIIGIIKLAHSLNLKVVAEGVETKAQEALLRHYRCDFMQGYGFSPPVPATALEKMLKEQARNLYSTDTG
ncbi:putative bifunctional diguanylate cyclase/phosphodiesterase [Microcoleus sp. FACHB-672]|uniref:putative bifunctional diguanylate cyclase/phosphodiesterase n=1 Tax=Microcoleus sp. FACHB-672 TaxID=2692825 RepID=UPI00168934B4|nr:EAL domain-containing response regulator [Microcoleus sp. FACHB-672]MBD2040000.1 EAL domain-containing protein [Microcoleus sp. FACHB-672]